MRLSVLGLLLSSTTEYEANLQIKDILEHNTRWSTYEWAES